MLGSAKPSSMFGESTQSSGIKDPLTVGISGTGKRGQHRQSAAHERKTGRTSLMGRHLFSHNTNSDNIQHAIVEAEGTKTI
jgi:hypothetical protein